MQLDDFLRTKSTHALLLAIFNAEMGLSSPAHPALQVEALLQSFKVLQQRAITDVRGSFTLDLRLPDGQIAGRAVISGMAEARLFGDLYGPLGAFTRLHGTGDLEHVLNHLVYPRVGPAVLKNLTIRAAVLKQLVDHGRRYGAHVQKRMLLTLSCFGLADLLQPLSDELQFAQAA